MEELRFEKGEYYCILCPHENPSHRLGVYRAIAEREDIKGHQGQPKIGYLGGGIKGYPSTSYFCGSSRVKHLLHGNNRAVRYCGRRGPLVRVDLVLLLLTLCYLKPTHC